MSLKKFKKQKGRAMVGFNTGSETFEAYLFKKYNDNSLFPPVMFPKEYVYGYTSALMDVVSVFEYIDDDLKLHKRKNAKTYHQRAGDKHRTYAR